MPDGQGSSLIIVVLLLLILTGSLSMAIFLAATDASWGMIALGYVAGGWGGLLLGGALVFLLSRLIRISQLKLHLPIRPRQPSSG